MTFFTKLSIKNVSIVLALPWLVACASSSAPHFANSSPASAAKGAGYDEDAVGQPEVRPITRQLVRLEKSRRDEQASADISQLAGPAKVYGIESGDILSIVVWDHPELTSASVVAPTPAIAGVAPGTASSPPTGFVVDHQGAIQFPYAGKIKVTGLTEEQARDMLTKKLAHYIRDPKVTLRVQSYRSKRVYIDGEVKNPGLQAIDDIPMTLMEALNRAGGMLPTADQSRITLSRQGKSYQINLPQLVQKGVNPAGIMLASGDVLRVTSRDESKVFVSGEVNAPRSLTMHNGRLTLNEALGESGGINPLSGDASQIYVIRKSEEEPVVYRLDAKKPGAMALAEGFELNPKDVVYVASTPLANWHRTISQILPGALSSAVGAANPVK